MNPSKQVAMTAFCALAALGLAAGTALADDDKGPRKTVKPLVQVSGDSPFGELSNCGDFPGFGNGTVFLDSEVEPWFDVNPVNPKNLVGYWQQDRWSDGGSRGNVAGVSLDGGKSWSIVPVPGQTDCTGGPFERSSDPWVSFSPNGVLHQMSLVFDTDPPTGGFGPNGMTASRSLDGGLTWSDPNLLIFDTEPNFLNDKNAMTADSTDSRFVYGVWDRLTLIEPTDPSTDFKGPAYLARSVDNGVSWEPAVEIFDPGLNNQVIGSQVVVLPDGTVLNFFNKIINVNPDGTFNNNPFRLTFLRSDDKGASWDGDTGGTEFAIILADGAVTPDHGVPIRDAAILFDVAVDRKRGTLYAVWQDFRFTGFDQVAFSQSKDGGETWINPVKINATPANAERPFTQQAFLPSVAVDDEGTAIVTYYDFRNDVAGADQPELADHFMIFCDRRCERPDSWKHETRLTDDSFDYLQAPFARGLFLGDYVGLAASGRSALAFFQQSSEDDPANGFFRKVIRGGGGDDDDDDDGDRYVLAED